MPDSPLQGRRIVVTRARDQAGSLASLLRERGATPVDLATIKIEPPDDWSPLDLAIANLNQYDWLVFTSSNAVRAVAERMSGRGQDRRELNSTRVAAIGSSTASALSTLGIKVDFVPTRFVAESLVQELSGLPLAGKRIMLPQAQDARDVVWRGLAAQGAIIDPVVVYRTCPDGDRASARQVFVANRIDAVTLTSSSTARNLAALLGDDAGQLLGGVVIASIGPITSQTARDFGLSVSVEAVEHTVRGLVDALEVLACSEPINAPGGSRVE